MLGVAHKSEGEIPGLSRNLPGTEQPAQVRFTPTALGRSIPSAPAPTPTLYRVPTAARSEENVGEICRVKHIAVLTHVPMKASLFSNALSTSSRSWFGRLSTIDAKRVPS